MKKVFFLSKGLEKFSDFEINKLELFKGGIDTGPDERFNHPTIANGGCNSNEVWSYILGKCVSKIEKERSFVSA